MHLLSAALGVCNIGNSKTYTGGSQHMAVQSPAEAKCTVKYLQGDVTHPTNNVLCTSKVPKGSRCMSL